VKIRKAKTAKENGECGANGTADRLTPPRQPRKALGRKSLAIHGVVSETDSDSDVEIGDAWRDLYKRFLLLKLQQQEVPVNL
jgi:hypothetical protein